MKVMNCLIVNLNVSRTWLAIVLVVATIGCQTVPGTQAPAPDSFAVFEADGDQVITKAVSPEGLVYRVRFAKHEPIADATFWREALTRKLERDGYLIVKSEARSVTGGPGGLVQAVAPLSTGDYGYIVAFAPLKDFVLIAESAGSRAELEKATPGILAAIDKIVVNQ